MTNRADGLETRRKLLDAAGILFAQRGYHGTKTSDICQAAEVNIAAVHYHFRSKDEIYIAAWRHEFERSIAAYPPDGGVPPDAPPEERLRGHIRALVSRAMDPASRDMDITHREMSNPTGLLREIMQRALEPLRQMHLGIIRDILGPAATDQDIQLCEMSIHAQCIASLMEERRRRQTHAQNGPLPPLWQNIKEDVLADHIFRFSLAGLREIRQAIEARGRTRGHGAT